jgi:hypothetical protein
MLVDNPTARVGSAGETVIGLTFRTVEFGTKKEAPIELTMLPERAAVLLRLLEELRDRGIVPEAAVEVSMHRHQ